jgi:putative ABC transport system ATP-binding protein
MNDFLKAGKTEQKEPAIEARGVTKVYNEGMESEVRVLKGIDLKIWRGEFVSIMGPSGSGKTTLLDIIGCLLKPTAGKVFIEGKEINGLKDSELAEIRGSRIGFVFQQYNLIPSSNALDNVELALRINGKGKKEARERARELLRLVGLEKRILHKPSELSGGEQQRVAIARALGNDPGIILADEPTGNLDTKTGKKILGLLKTLNRERGYTVVVVTHDPGIGKYADKIIKLRDGEIIEGK